MSGQLHACGEAEQVQEPEHPPLPYQQLITRAAQALGMDMPVEHGQRASRFVDEKAGQSRSFSVPLLPDLLTQFTKPSEPHRWSGLCRRLACVDGRERIGCGPPPPMDQALGALVSPTKSVLGKPSCPGKNTKMMVAMLGRLHAAVAVQSWLVNTGASLVSMPACKTVGGWGLRPSYQVTANVLAPGYTYEGVLRPRLGEQRRNINEAEKMTFCNKKL